MGRTQHEDATAQARQWAAENPIAAEQTGVRLAMDCATRWKEARDALLLKCDADEKVTHALYVQLKRMLEHVRVAGVLDPRLESVINDADTAVRKAEAAGWKA